MLSYIRHTFKQSTQAFSALPIHLKVFLLLPSPGVRNKFVKTRGTNFLEPIKALLKMFVYEHVFIYRTFNFLLTSRLVGIQILLINKANRDKSVHQRAVNTVMVLASTV